MDFSQHNLDLAPFMISGEDLLGAMRISLYVF